MFFVVFSLEHRSIFCAEVGAELWKESHLYSIQTIRQHQVWNFSLRRQGKTTEKKKALPMKNIQFTVFADIKNNDAKNQMINHNLSRKCLWRENKLELVLLLSLTDRTCGANFPR